MKLQDIIYLPQWEQIEPLEWIARVRMQEFLQLHGKHPLPDHNPSYISLSEAFWLWNLVRDLEPKFVVESGTDEGYSAWWLQQAMPVEGTLWTHDPRGQPKVALNRTEHIHFSLDFIHRNVESGSQCFAFFDDHQDQPERLKEAAKRGFHDVCFHDCYPQANSAHVSLWRTGLPEKAICMQFPILRSPDVFREPARSMSAWLTWVRLPF